MKKIAIAILVCSPFFFVFNAHAQTLQFSQALLVQKNTTDTVPAGHVWKVETWTLKSEYCGGYNSNPVYFNLNGVSHYLQASFRDGNGLSYDGGSRSGAMWLPSGTIVSIPNSGDCLQALFILEFSVIP